MIEYNNKYHGKRTSQEVIDFITANFEEMSDRELSKNINRQFNLNTTRTGIRSFRIYHKIYKGGRRKPVLTERTDERGYIKIKTSNGKWINKHKYLYEQAYGKVPKVI